MAEKCADNQNIEGADPTKQAPNSGALKVDLKATADSIFNPNAALSALNTYLTMNNVANKMFGIEARWFRAVPQERSKDVIFQEWTLYCVEETPLCIKVLLPDGTFPDSKYQYDLMGLEYEVPLEIHIDKRYWEEYAGFGTAPQKKDIVYLPLPNKLYQVESSYLKRGFMEQETTWIINLIKYMPEAARRESDALKETIDKYTVSAEEVFGEEMRDEYAKLTDDKQFSQFNSTEIDKYKVLDPDLQIVTTNLEFYGLMVAESIYDLGSSRHFNAVKYKNSTDEITDTSDRAITEWIYLKSPTQAEYDIVWIQKDTLLPIPANYKIKLKTTHRFELNDVFLISRAGSLSFYATVVDNSNSNNNIYYCKIDTAVENYLNSINSNWANARNYKLRVRNPITILDGRNTTNTGFRILLYANQYLKIIYGNQEYIAIFDSKLNYEEWYGIVINIGNSWGQYNVYVWESSNDRESKIRIKYYDTIKFEPVYTKVEEYTLDKSDAYITNIRLFKTTIEEEKQANELLSYFSKDADQALILDNCEQQFRAPYISQQR